MKNYICQLAKIIKKEFTAENPSYNIFCHPVCPKCGTSETCKRMVFSEELYWKGKSIPNNLALFDFIDKHSHKYIFGECKRLYPDSTNLKFISNLYKLQTRVKKYQKKHPCKFIIITANSKINSNDAINDLETKIRTLQSIAPIDFQNIEIKLCSDIMC